MFFKNLKKNIYFKNKKINFIFSLIIYKIEKIINSNNNEIIFNIIIFF